MAITNPEEERRVILQRIFKSLIFDKNSKACTETRKFGLWGTGTGQGIQYGLLVNRLMLELTGKAFRAAIM